VDGANAFAFDLMPAATRALRPDSNAFLSPLSASMALGMTLNGADGKTLMDLQTALRLKDVTEAAAATSVGVSVTSARQGFQMKVDRPFLFAIRERLSGTVVFLGVMKVVGS
jgi:serine protease inhibitor